jgi:CelD/BcsL family acetyltransferase involved in cellulose biosynthesis
MSAPPPPTAQVIVADDLEALAPHLDAWDALAVERSRPFCAPAWMLAWWSQARIGDARLRIVLVSDEHGLMAVGPFFAQVGPLGLVEMRLLGAGFCHRIGPLARPGQEAPAAAALAEALAAMQPRPVSVVFEGMDSDDPWPDLIAAAWPGRTPPRLRTDATMDAPAIDLGGAYEDWMERRGRKFRKEARRTARRLEEEQVHGEISVTAEAIDALLRLNHARWEGRGGSHVGDAASRVIAQAAGDLGQDRLMVALLQGPNGSVAAELVLVAGRTAAFWGGGFDPAWASYAPGTQAMLVALRHLADQDVQIADLGGGEHEYKRRLADGNSPIVWRTLFPRGARYPLLRARLAPKHLAHAMRRMARRLPAGWRGRLKRLSDRA